MRGVPNVEGVPNESETKINFNEGTAISKGAATSTDFNQGTAISKGATTSMPNKNDEYA